jgi:hypothetical protein
VRPTDPDRFKQFGLGIKLDAVDAIERKHLLHAMTLALHAGIQKNDRL